MGVCGGWGARGGGGVMVTVKVKRGEEMNFKHLYVKGFLCRIRRD